MGRFKFGSEINIFGESSPRSWTNIVKSDWCVNFGYIAPAMELLLPEKYSFLKISFFEVSDP